MKTLFKTTFLGLAVCGAANAQDLVISNQDCTVALQAGSAVTFNQDGGISVLTADLPASCVSGVIGGGTPASIQAADPLTGALVSSADEETEFVINYAVPEGFQCTIRKNSATFLNNGGIDRPSGTSSVETITSTTNYELSCTQATPQGTATAGASALVNFTGSTGGGGGFEPGATCPQLPNNAQKAPSVSFDRNEQGGELTATTVEQLFGAWPVADNFAGRVYRLTLRRNQYVSLPFSIPAGTPSTEVLNLIWEAASSPSDGTIVSVSECVGGVLSSQAVAQPNERARFCHIQGVRSGGGIRIGTNPNFANCVLDTGKTYYLNFMDYDENSGTSTCDQANCTWLGTPSSN